MVGTTLRIGKGEIATTDGVAQVQRGLDVLEMWAPMITGDQGPETAEHNVHICVTAVALVQS